MMSFEESSPRGSRPAAGIWTAMAVAWAASACGGPEDMAGVLRGEITPTSRKARVTITPALDLRGLAESEWASDLAVDRVAVHLTEVRLLGDDPRIPAGGLALLQAPQVVYADGDGQFGLELPFPPEFMNEEGLAVYIRTGPSAELDGAAVRVEGVFSSRTFALSASGADGQVIDPDGEPVSPSGEVIDPDGEPVSPSGEVIDPDGEPVSSGGEVIDPDGEPVASEGEVIDPDGEPVQCDGGVCAQQGQGLTAGQRVVLLDRQGTELVVAFDSRSHFDVVFGIRAAPWLQALENRQPGGQPIDPDPDHRAEDLPDGHVAASVVLERNEGEGDLADGPLGGTGGEETPPPQTEEGTYYLTEGQWRPRNPWGGPGGGL